MPSQRATVPRDVVAKLRLICLGLPDACEESAWVGTRWCIRKKNFAHVLMIDAGWPPAYARVAGGGDGPSCVLTFRVSGQSFARDPLFRPGWWPNIVGMRLDDRVDWDEVERLLTES